MEQPICQKGNSQDNRDWKIPRECQWCNVDGKPEVFTERKQLSQPLSDSKMEEKGRLSFPKIIFLVLSQTVVETRSNVEMVALSQYAEGRGCKQSQTDRVAVVFGRTGIVLFLGIEGFVNYRVESKVSMGFGLIQAIADENTRKLEDSQIR